MLSLIFPLNINDDLINHIIDHLSKYYHNSKKNIELYDIATWFEKDDEEWKILLENIKKKMFLHEIHHIKFTYYEYFFNFRIYKEHIHGSYRLHRFVKK